MKKFLLYGLGFLLLFGIGVLFPGKSTQYTKSGNCDGPSVSTLRFEPEPTAAMLPEAIWFEECPSGKYFQKIDDGQWKEITKKEADNGAGVLNLAGRKYVKVVD